MTATVNLALFDLDGTLLPIDSDHAWGEFMVALGWVDGGGVSRRQRRVLCRLPGRPLDIAAYIAFATAPLRERSAAEARRPRASASCAR